MQQASCALGRCRIVRCFRQRVNWAIILDSIGVLRREVTIFAYAGSFMSRCPSCKISAEVCFAFADRFCNIRSGERPVDAKGKDALVGVYLMPMRSMYTGFGLAEQSKWDEQFT